jgi:hypothetical protein
MSRFMVPVFATVLLPLLVVVIIPAENASQPAGNPEQVVPRELAPPPRISWPMYGGSPSRNMVNLHDKLPELPLVGPSEDKEGEKKWNARWLLWKAALGSRSYSQPVVAGGRVFVGTNN